MKLQKILFGLLLTAVCSQVWAYPTAPMDEQNPPRTRSTYNLKQYMSKFGAMLAGLEILKIKEKKPDWDAINITLQEMSSNLAEMQKADVDSRYKEYTDVLAAGLVDLKAQSKIRDKKIFDGIDKLAQTCFQCHAAHRPADFILPKKNQRISGIEEK